MGDKIGKIWTWGLNIYLQPGLGLKISLARGISLWNRLDCVKKYIATFHCYYYYCNICTYFRDYCNP